MLKTLSKIVAYSSSCGPFFFNPKVLIFFLFLHENICCGTHLKCLMEALLMSTHNIVEALLMSTHNICFRGEIRKILT